MSEATGPRGDRRPRELPRRPCSWPGSTRLVAGVHNYGRMDVAFGPLLARDLDAGRLDRRRRPSALLESLWRLMAARRTIYNGRVIVGGAGRPDPESADRFARLALEATRRVNEVEPQLTFRFDRDTDPELMALAYDVIGEGRTFPMLYNDDGQRPRGGDRPSECRSPRPSSTLPLGMRRVRCSSGAPWEPPTGSSTC